MFLPELYRCRNPSSHTIQSARSAIKSCIDVFNRWQHGHDLDGSTQLHGRRSTLVPTDILVRLRSLCQIPNYPSLIGRHSQQRQLRLHRPPHCHNQPHFQHRCGSAHKCAGAKRGIRMRLLHSREPRLAGWNAGLLFLPRRPRRPRSASSPPHPHRRYTAQDRLRLHHPANPRQESQRRFLRRRSRRRLPYPGETHLHSLSEHLQHAGLVGRGRGIDILLAHCVLGE